MCEGVFAFLLVICADQANLLWGDGDLNEQIQRFVRNNINAIVSGGGDLAKPPISESEHK